MAVLRQLAAHPPALAAGPVALVRAPARPTILRRRPFRVVTLGLAIGVMSGVDLYLTLLYLTHTGMSEANPLARMMIAYQSPAVLVCWKSLTVGLCLGILYLVRDRRSAELGAWTGAVILGWLMTHWGTYINTKDDIGPDFQLVSAEIDPRFVRLFPIEP